MGLLLQAVDKKKNKTDEIGSKLGRIVEDVSLVFEKHP